MVRLLEDDLADQALEVVLELVWAHPDLRRGVPIALAYIAGLAPEVQRALFARCTLETWASTEGENPCC